MTLAELKTQCLISKGHGSSITTLVIPRKSPPVDDFIRVKGMGKGYVLNAVQRNGRWEICAHFNVDTILRTIAKQEALDATRAEGLCACGGDCEATVNGSCTRCGLKYKGRICHGKG